MSIVDRQPMPMCTAALFILNAYFFQICRQPKTCFTSPTHAILICTGRHMNGRTLLIWFDDPKMFCIETVRAVSRPSMQSKLMHCVGQRMTASQVSDVKLPQLLCILDSVLSFFFFFVVFVCLPEGASDGRGKKSGGKKERESERGRCWVGRKDHKVLYALVSFRSCLFPHSCWNFVALLCHWLERVVWRYVCALCVYMRAVSGLFVPWVCSVWKTGLNVDYVLVASMRFRRV